MHSSRNIQNSDSSSVLGLRPTYHRVGSIDVDGENLELGDIGRSAPSTYSDITSHLSNYTPSIEPLRTTTEDLFGQSPHEVNLTKAVPAIKTKRHAWPHWNPRQGWRFGVLVGCYISAVVLTINFILLLVGVFRYGGFTMGSFSWNLTTPLGNTQVQTNWTEWDGKTPIEAQVSLSNNGTFHLIGSTTYRKVYNISDYTKFQDALPHIVWPNLTVVNASEIHSISDVPLVASLLSDAYWLSSPYLHVNYALSNPIKNSSSIQIGLIFMIIVIIANATKLAVMYTLYKDPSSHLVAMGDVVASFLARPDTTTAGMCNLDKVILSISYFTLNRLVTTLHIAQEWNTYGTIRKGLRVPNPTPDSCQRPTYFLDLPFRWAIPLICISGLLHWLLS
ncbi:hypothetical protein K432DRAFT_410535 [Lepidopterella palustris CBS 459.81]|uniref:Uncharacterized protein n=1 Tax=Lepidopterella palustris CBS 459.81 TaxID=1314670 RepID=A0A8E2DXV7_9PEZI|nr:hypothetical protein K432DRAFT_410535 [Lepidopterella palustris CBS 459.81]